MAYGLVRRNPKTKDAIGATSDPAHELSAGRPLEERSNYAAIAQRTVSAACRERRF